MKGLSTVTGTGAPLQRYQIESSDSQNINKATVFIISPDVFVTQIYSFLYPLPPSSSLSSFLLDDMNVDVPTQGRKYVSFDKVTRPI